MEDQKKQSVEEAKAKQRNRANTTQPKGQNKKGKNSDILESHQHLKMQESASQNGMYSMIPPPYLMQIKEDRQLERLRQHYYITYELNENENAIFQLMMHKNNYQGEILFKKFDSSLVLVGNRCFVVYHCTQDIPPGYRDDYQIRLLSIGLRDRDYYEPIHHHRQYYEGCHQFVWGLNIVRNDTHLAYKDPPGKSIKNPLDQLLIFTAFCLETKNYDALKSLIAQFPQVYKGLLVDVPDKEHSWSKFGAHFDVLIQTFYEQLPHVVKYILDVNSLLPLKVIDFKDFMMSSNDVVIEAGTQYFATIKDEETDNDQEEEILMKYLSTIKGYILQMIFNKISHSEEWLNSLMKIINEKPSLFRPILKHLLFYFQTNKLLITDEQHETLQGLIDEGYHEQLISLEAAIDLKTILLDFSPKFEFFFTRLSDVLMFIKLFSSETDIPPEDIELLSQEADIMRRSMTLAIEYFVTNRINSLPDAVDFISFYIEAPEQVKELIQVSSFPKNIEKVALDYVNSKEIIDIEVFKKLFFTYFDPNLFENPSELFAIVINIMLYQRNQSFRFTYEHLLMAWNDKAFNIAAAHENIKFKVQLRQKIEFIIESLDTLHFQLTNISKTSTNGDQQKFLEEVAQICLEEVDLLLKRSDTNLIVYLRCFEKSQSQLFQNEYCQRVKLLLTTYNTNDIQQTLQLLVKYKATIESKSQYYNVRIANILIEEIFTQYFIKPTYDQVKMELFSNPSLDHTWFRVLEAYDYYKDYDFTKQLCTHLDVLSSKIQAKSLPLKDISSLKLLTHEQRENINKYLNKARVNQKIDFQNYLEMFNNQILEADQIVKRNTQLNYLFLIFLKLDETTNPLPSKFKAQTKDFFEKSLLNQELSPDLMTHLEIADIVYTLKDSKIFKKLYEYHHEVSNFIQEDEFNPDAKIFYCHEAYNELKQNISSFINQQDLQIWTLKWVKNQVLQKQILNSNQIEVEVGYLERIIKPPLTQEQKAKFSLLKQVMQAILDQKSLTEHCNNIEILASMTIHQEHQEQEQLQIMDKTREFIFKVDFDHERDLSNRFLSQCSEVIDKISIHEYLELLNHTQHQLIDSLEAANQEEREKLLQIFSNLAQSREFLSFLRQITSEDLQSVKEYVNEYDENMINTELIEDYLKFQQFMGELDNLANQQRSPLNYLQFIDQIKRSLNKLLPNFSEMLQGCQRQIYSVYDLMNNLESKEEAKKKQIIEIIKICDFRFIQENNEWQLKLSYQREDNTNEYDIEMLLDLKERAQLIQHTASFATQQSFNEEKSNQHQDIGTFIHFATLIKQTLDHFSKLWLYGYPDIIQEFQTKFICRKGQYQELIITEQQTCQCLKFWEETFVEACKSNYWLTFIDGRNIWIIEKYLYRQRRLSDQDIKRAQNILQFMNKSHDIIRYNFVQDGDNDPKSRLLKIGSMLQQIESLPVKRIEVNIETNHILNLKNDKILYLEFSNPIVGILSIFISAQLPLPRPDQLFFCHPETNMKQLQSFVFRSLISNNHELHLIIKPELLNLEIQENFSQLISSLKTNQFNATPLYLGFVTSEPTAYVSKSIKKESFTMILRDSIILEEDEIQEVMGKIDTRTTFISSSRAGLGKTHYVQKRAEKKGKKLLVFPIAGLISYEEIGERLVSKDFEEETIILFQINLVKNVQLLNEILTNLALFKILKSQLDIFILPDNCEIWVELANTFNNSLQNNIDFAKYTRQFKIEDFQIDQLDLNDQIVEVCAGLELFDNHTILNRNLEEQDIINMSQNRNRCIDLINKYFIMEQQKCGQMPNFIQLTIFVKVLLSLFRNFSKCNYFMTEQIQLTIVEYQQADANLSALIEEYTKIRLTVIQSVLLTVQEFTTKSINRQLGQVQKTSISVIQQDSFGKHQTMIQSPDKKEDKGKLEDSQIDQSISDTLSVSDTMKLLESNFKLGHRWETQDHFTAVFVEDGTPMFIYKDQNQIPQDIKKLIFIQEQANDLNGFEIDQKIMNGTFKIQNLHNLSSNELSQRLNILRTQQNKLEKRTDYVVTTDNFLKMCVIYMRIQAKLPVIIMGETGCGKTTLIDYLCTYIRQEQLEIFNIHAGITYDHIIKRMESYVEKAQQLEEEALLEQKDKIAKAKPEFKDQIKVQQKNLWLFFDEFNTSENIGLICEILCERKLLGAKLPDNICLLAACNPYKLRKRGLLIEENVGIKKRITHGNLQSNMLLYTVYPLPDNVLEYVFDFGALDQGDYYKYIEQMLLTARNIGRLVSQEENLSDSEIDEGSDEDYDLEIFGYGFEREERKQEHHPQKNSNDKSIIHIAEQIDAAENFKILKMMQNILVLCHEYFKENEEASSVSLRDINRFNRLYHWFNNSLLEKRKIYGKYGFSKQQQENKLRYQFETLPLLDDEQIKFRANILALTHCYYLRIANHQVRRKFLEYICQADKAEDNGLTPDLIEEIMNQEQVDYLCRMSLPKGTAINQALKENIFALIPCIMEKIPVFICGKPGCSKSLAITLINNNIGKKSQDNYFQTFPDLQLFQFQGSESCTSDGIIYAFQRAEKFLQKNKNILPVFVFDEIGLAEISVHNPLKVLHSLLDKQNDIAFVGISNWRLDASKMNRGLYLARPDPDQNDLISTAMSIYKSICEQDQNDLHQAVITNLAESYFDLKAHFKSTHPVYCDFYGLRDFYHLIKQISRVIQVRSCNIEDKELYQQVKNSVFRNFGGKFKAAKKFFGTFVKLQKIEDLGNELQTQTPLELIKENLQDQHSRYLMIIAKPDVAAYLIEKQFSTMFKEKRTIVGSKLEDDNNKEEYGFQSLNDIIHFLEKGISIILKDMDHIYSSLYDLFNQSFSTLRDSNFCRIALGALFNPKCLVHQQFRCVIFMKDDEDSLQKADAPFLNRFEKHYLKLEQILTDKHKQVVDRIQKWVKHLLTLNFQANKKLINKLSETDLFPTYNKESIGLLVLRADEITQESQVLIKNSELDQDSLMQSQVNIIFEYCKNEFLKCASEDILVCCQINQLDDDERKNIISQYRSLHKTSYREYVNELQNKPDLQDQHLTKKIVAFTYTIGQRLQIQSNAVNIRSVSNFKSEEELVKHLSEFYQSPQECVQILEADYQKDYSHISFMKYVIEKVEGEFYSKNDENVQMMPLRKSVILLINLLRSKSEGAQSTLPLFGDGWETKIFYNIQENPFSLVTNFEILNQNIIDIVTKKNLDSQNLIDFNQVLEQQTEQSLLKLKFQQQDLDDQEQEDKGAQLSQKQIKSRIRQNLDRIIDNITRDNKLVEFLQFKINNEIQKIGKSQDWLLKVCTDPVVFQSCHNVIEAIRFVISNMIEEQLIKVLYLIESNSSFMSYFTDEDQPWSPKIKDIWISIFSTMNIGIVHIQSISQSNYIKYIYNLQFPFSNLEHVVLKEITQQQKCYEWNNQNNQRFVKMHNFMELFKQNSKVSSKLDILLELEQLQSLYLKDQIRLFLLENFLSAEYEQHIFIVINGSDFFDKLYKLLMMQSSYVVFCKIIDIYKQIKGDTVSHEQIKSVIIECITKHGETEKLEKILASIIDVFIIDIYPVEVNLAQIKRRSAAGIDHLQTLSTYSAYLEKIISLAYKVQLELSLKRLTELKFWLDISAALTQLPKESDCFNFLTFCGKEAKEIESMDNHHLFLEDEGFIESVTNHFIKYEDNERAIQFLSSFYSTIIQFNSAHVQYIASVFDQLGDKFFKYSSRLFSLFINQSGMKKQLDQFEQKICQDRNNEYDLELLDQRGFFKQFEHIFIEKGVCCKFAIALSDALIRSMSDDKELMEQQNLLQQLFVLFENYMHISVQEDVQHDQFPLTKKLIALALIKSYLNIYSKVLFLRHHPHPPNDWEYFPSEEYDNMLIQIDNYFLNCPFKLTLMTYCLKKLKQLFGFTKEQIKQFAKEKLYIHYNWIQELDQALCLDQDQMQANMEQNVFILPFIEELNEEEVKLQTLIKQICINNEGQTRTDFKRLLQQVNTPRSRLVVGLAFLKAIFVKFTQQEATVNQHLQEFYNRELHQQILDLVLGPEYATLIGYFITNFPLGHGLQLDYQLEQRIINQRIVACYILILVFSYKDQPNPLTGQFFKDGTFSLSVLDSSFLCGLQLNSKHQYIKDTYFNYDELKSDTWDGDYGGDYSKGSCYKCGNKGCDYVYFVLDCGGVTQELPCPWCGATIGGRGHQVFEREGHANLTDEEAKEYLRAIYERHKMEQLPGYNPIEFPEQNISQTYSELHSVTWRFLRLFLHVPLYYLSNENKDLFKPTDNQQNHHPLSKQGGMSAHQFLELHMKNDLAIIFTQLAEFGNDVTAPFLYHIIGQMIRLFEDNQDNPPTTIQVRDDFQRIVNEKLILANLQDVGHISKAYILRQLDENNTLDILLEEIFTDVSDAPYLELFRITSDFSFETMKAAFFNNPQNHVNYQILKICFDNFDTIKRLRHFYPIIEFVQELLSIMDHQMTRQEARTKQIKSFFANNIQMKALFDKFAEAWSNAGFDRKIQYECHKLECLKYNENFEIINFLIDNKEPGPRTGMCMAAGLSELSTVQNKILNDIQRAYVKEKNIRSEMIFDTTHYPVQRLQHDNILDVKLDSKTIMSTCSLNNLNYGQGQQIIYDFARLQQNLLVTILDKKLISASNMQFIKYQQELPITDIIQQIRRKYPQGQLSDMNAKTIQDRLNMLSNQNPIKVKDLYFSLEKVMCFLLDSKAQLEETIIQFCSNFNQNRIDSLLTEKSVYSFIPIKNIVNLFELVEAKYLPICKVTIREEFRNAEHGAQINRQMEELIQKFIDQKDNSLPTRQQFQQAIMRFMTRCLAASLDPHIPIFYYLFNEGLWDQTVSSVKLTNVENDFPQELSLDHTVCLYDTVERINTVHDNKTQVNKFKFQQPQYMGGHNNRGNLGRQQQRQDIEYNPM